MMVMVERMMVEEDDDDDDDDDGDMLVFGSILPLGELNVKAPPPPQRGSKLMANLANQDYKSKVGALDWLGIKASIPDIRTWKPRSWRATSAGMTPSLVSIYIYINL